MKNRIEIELNTQDVKLIDSIVKKMIASLNAQQLEVIDKFNVMSICADIQVPLDEDDKFI